MKQPYLILAVLVLVGAAGAMDEYKAGENITIRSMFADKGVPTTGAVCLLNLWSQTDNILSNTSMTDSGDGFYNYTITGWLTTDNRTVYDGYVYCNKAGISGSTSFSFLLVRQTTDDWMNDQNTTTGQIKQIVNETLDVTKQINQTLGNIEGLTNQTLDVNKDINKTLADILNATQTQATQQNTLLDNIARIMNIVGQRISSILEYNMKDKAHYRIMATTDNCTFAQNKIVLDTYTIGKMYNPASDLDPGLYCFKVMEYDPISNSYGISSTPKYLYVNNTI